MRLPLALSEDSITVIASARFGRTYYPRLTFLIDTGSPTSFISYGDAIRAQFPVSSLKSDMKMRWSKDFDLCPINEVRLAFLNENNMITRINRDKFYVARPSKKKESRELSTQLPSILGLDFLKENRLRLYVDPANKEAFLEK